MTEEKSEMQKLDDFHAELAAKEPAGQASRLRNGFLPEDTAALIEAGIRCIPLIECGNAEVAAGAADRLKAVVFKLRLAETSVIVRRVLEQFDRLLAEQRKEQRSGVVFGLLVVAGLATVIGCLIFLIVRFFFR